LAFPASRAGAHKRFRYRRERLFNRIEIGTVRRQEADLRAEGTQITPIAVSARSGRRPPGMSAREAVPSIRSLIVESVKSA
jgi:hypothetical protein